MQNVSRAVKSIISALLILGMCLPLITKADTDFNPSYIISDAEMQDYQSWTRDDVQKFLDAKGSYLRSYSTYDENNAFLPAADIIYNAAQTYQVSPKYLLVTLQKEQSLVTDDSPTDRQLNWATGYAVCDGCDLNDPKVLKYKGFGKQVAGAAGIIRWYYSNQSNGIVKKANVPIQIDNTPVVPQSWATAFLYTYTPHLHGNKNFARIWNTWFTQYFPDGTLLKNASTSEYWLIQDGKRRAFANLTAVITRTDPKLAISVSDIDMANYRLGAPISFPNYSLLRVASSTYMIDGDTLRPFQSDAVVADLGFNPDEINDVTSVDIAGLTVGDPITATSTAPTGVIYQITELSNTYYLLKDGVVYPITDKKVVETNYKGIDIKKHKMSDLKGFSLSETPLTFRDGTLLQATDSNTVYVIDKGKKRRIADNDTFRALGYKRANVTPVSQALLVTIPEGERLFMNASLVSSHNKFLGDSLTPVADQFTTNLPTYLVAEYPSGRLISGKNIDTVGHMGSLSALLTAYEGLQNGFNTKGTSLFDDRVIKPQKNSLSLRRNEKIKNTDLLTALLLSTPKDVVHMVAANTDVGEAGLANEVMNRMDDWGADSTNYQSADSEENNKTSARDLLKIAVKTLDDPSVGTALGKTSASIRKVVSKGVAAVTIQNSNKIISLYPATKRNYKILATMADTWGDLDKPILMIVETKVKKGQTPKQYVIITFGTLSGKQPFEEANKLATWIASGNVKISGK